MTSQTSVTLGAWAQVEDSLLRIAGRDLAIAQQIARWVSENENSLPVQFVVSEAADDPGLILPRLRVRQPDRQYGALPARRPSFAQLDEQQRWVYLDWLTRRERLPGIGYAYLYLYGLEAGLFDSCAARCCAEIQWLAAQCDDAEFQAQAAVDAALGAWLTQSADVFAWAMNRLAWDGPYAGALLWMQAALGLDLAPRQLMALSPACGYMPQAGQDLLEPYVQVGLRAHLESQGAPWLGHLENHPDRWPVDMRLANPAARFTLFIPDAMTASFRQAVSGLVALADREARARRVAQKEPDAGGAEAAEGKGGGREWYVVIEFGESLSEQFAQAVALAKKQPGYTRLLDEKRALVHRVIFRRKDLRQFWALLDLVRLWKTARVYVNGQERDASQLWPHTSLE